MHLAVSRYLALLFAIGLAIGETIISWGHWQFAPLWIIDYLVAVCLLYAFYRTRNTANIHTLIAAWAFSLGVFYMDLFVNLDPQVAPSLRPTPVVMGLIVLVLGLSLIGFFTALLAIRAQSLESSVK
jgi:xanthine/uracil permease